MHSEHEESEARQAEALESFYKDWDDIKADPAYESALIVTQSGPFVVIQVGAIVIFCPITAVLVEAS